MTYPTRIPPAAFRRTLESPAQRAQCISGPHREVGTGEHVAGVVLAVIVGVVMACALVHWWSS